VERKLGVADLPRTGKIAQMAPVTTVACSSEISHSTFWQAELMAAVSVPIRRALREQRAVWTRLIDNTGNRGRGKNPSAVG